MPNTNRIVTSDFSNADSKSLYEKKWPENPVVAEKHRMGEQCGACACFGELNEDWGICCNRKSQHYLETTFEHFTCAEQINAGWNNGDEDDV
jgi:hypothetical protein